MDGWDCMDGWWMGIVWYKLHDLGCSEWISAFVRLVEPLSEKNSIEETKPGNNMQQPGGTRMVKDEVRRT